MPATITEPPYFRFWQESTMDNQAFTLSFSRDLAETNTSKKGVVYFGSPLETVKLQTTINAVIDSVAQIGAIWRHLCRRCAACF